MKDLLLAKASKNLCPICNKQVNQNFTVVAYNGIDLKVCKMHIKYGELKNEQKNSI